MYFSFGPDSPIQLQKLSDDVFQQIPILNLIKNLGKLIKDEGSIKLTAKGFLPTKIVAELYRQGFYKDEIIERFHKKLYKETDSNSIHLTRILMELAGLAKKSKGKLSLTKSGEKILQDNDKLAHLILTNYVNKLNWAYFDGYRENNIGQLGFGFSLILIFIYGKEKKLETFYAEKYFKAFPQLLHGITPVYCTAMEYASNCYASRTFSRFLSFFGLIHITPESASIFAKDYISKTPLFDLWIKCLPHQVR